MELSNVCRNSVKLGKGGRKEKETTKIGPHVNVGRK